MMSNKNRACVWRVSHLVLGCDKEGMILEGNVRKNCIGSGHIHWIYWPERKNSQVAKIQIKVDLE